MQNDGRNWDSVSSLPEILNIEIREQLLSNNKMTTTHKILTGGREIMTIESKEGFTDLLSGCDISHD